MIHQVRVSVRNLVEFILRNGDIDQKTGALQDVDAMQAGSRAHRKLQKQGGSNYKAEVFMKCQMDIDEELTIQVEGRADGVITDPSDENNIIIDEIKGTFTKLDAIEEPDILHTAQADCYAYMYAVQKELNQIRVRITYIQLETEEIKTFEFVRECDALKEWFESLVLQYAKWARWQIGWQELRDDSIKNTRFPYAYRISQKRMMNGVYRSIEEKKNIFIQAPTGTGKTLGTLFPSIKAMGAGKCGRIFYLTAKTITRTVAQEAGELLSEHGLRMKFITLTAKEKICPLEECRCHFNRVCT